MSPDDLDTWRAVFDIAIGSMNFGSGFLDHEEVEHLRKAAVILGVDPELATPDNFLCQYRDYHDPTWWSTDLSFFESWADGLERNALRYTDKDGGYQRGQPLVKIRGLRIQVWCHLCGRRMYALGDCPQSFVTTGEKTHRFDEDDDDAELQ